MHTHENLRARDGVWRCMSGPRDSGDRLGRTLPNEATAARAQSRMLSTCSRSSVTTLMSSSWTAPLLAATISVRTARSASRRRDDRINRAPFAANCLASSLPADRPRRARTFMCARSARCVPARGAGAAHGRRLTDAGRCPGDPHHLALVAILGHRPRPRCGIVARVQQAVGKLGARERHGQDRGGADPRQVQRGRSANEHAHVIGFPHQVEPEPHHAWSQLCAVGSVT